MNYPVCAEPGVSVDLQVSIYLQLPLTGINGTRPEWDARGRAFAVNSSISCSCGNGPTKMMPAERFELPTNGLQNRCSTTELSRPWEASRVLICGGADCTYPTFIT